MTLKFDGWPWKKQGTTSLPHQALCIISKPSVNSNWSYSPETPNSGQNRWFFVTCDLEIWWMTLINNRAQHLSYTTLSFVHHFKAMGEFKLELQSGNAQFGSELMIFLSHVTLKFYRWPWKTIRHLFYASSSFVHHFISIIEFKLKLQSGNT